MTLARKKICGSYGLGEERLLYVNGIKKPVLQDTFTQNVKKFAVPQKGNNLDDLSCSPE